MNWLSTFFFTIPFILNAQSFKEKLSKSNPGDFIVYEQNKSLELLLIKQNQKNNIVIEQITAPLSSKKLIKGDWQKWLNDGAPKHTSDISIHLSLNSPEIADCYCFDKKAFLKIEKEDSFLLQMLDTEFAEVPLKDRSKIGPLRTVGADTRKLWNPPLIIHGEKVEKREFRVYKLFLKSLSKSLSLYFHESFPFPHLINIENPSSRGHKIRAIDSGTNLTSPKEFAIRKANE